MSTTDPQPRRRWVAPSLRGMLVLIIFLGLWLGWIVHKARQQREAVAAVQKYGGWIRYEDEFAVGPVVVEEGNLLWKTSWGKFTSSLKPRAPAWQRRLLGDEYFRKIAHVSLFVDIQKGIPRASNYDHGPALDVLEKLSTQSSIKTLQIGGPQATDAGLKFVDRMSGLEELIVFPAREITDVGVAHLEGMLKLRVLYLAESKLTDTGLASLAKPPRIE